MIAASDIRATAAPLPTTDDDAAISRAGAGDAATAADDVVAEASELHDVRNHRVLRSAVLRTVARRAFPRIVEATIIPAVIFYVMLLAVGPTAAVFAALLWSWCAIARRRLMHQPVPAVLALATVGFTVRTAIALASGSTFIYFMQPVLGTVIMALVFLGSIAIGRPLIAKLAHDFWPLDPEVAAHPAVLRLFRGLTVLWAGVNFAIAGVTFLLLCTLPIEGFVPAKTVSSYVITITGVLVTISWSIATARREGLLGAATEHLKSRPVPAS